MSFAGHIIQVQTDDQQITVNVDRVTKVVARESIWRHRARLLQPR